MSPARPHCSSKYSGGLGLGKSMLPARQQWLAFTKTTSSWRWTRLGTLPGNNAAFLNSCSGPQSKSTNVVLPKGSLLLVFKSKHLNVEVCAKTYSHKLWLYVFAQGEDGLIRSQCAQGIKQPKAAQILTFRWNAQTNLFTDHSQRCIFSGCNKENFPFSVQKFWNWGWFLHLFQTIFHVWSRSGSCCNHHWTATWRGGEYTPLAIGIRTRANLCNLTHKQG